METVKICSVSTRGQYSVFVSYSPIKTNEVFSGSKEACAKIAAALVAQGVIYDTVNSDIMITQKGTGKCIQLLKATEDDIEEISDDNIEFVDKNEKYLSIL